MSGPSSRPSVLGTLPFPRAVLLHPKAGSIEDWLAWVDLDGNQRARDERDGRAGIRRKAIERALQLATSTTAYMDEDAPMVEGKSEGERPGISVTPDVDLALRRLGTVDSLYQRWICNLGSPCSLVSLHHASYMLCDLTIPLNAEWFVRAVARLAHNVAAHFAFSTLTRLEGHVFHPERVAEREPLVHPARMAWDLTYYGPRMVTELTWPALASAPAYSAMRDERGGAWVRLVRNPFDLPADIEQRRQAFADHLRLTERFEWLPDPGPALLP
jgi:hypothetical protein